MSDIKDRINSYEDACAILGRKPLTLADFSALPEADQQPFFSLHKITTAIEAINEGHVFDWNNWEERKYYAWWDMETYSDAPAGSGFSVVVYDDARTDTSVGSRLCTRTEAHTEHLAKVLLDDYRHWIKK